MSVKQRILQCEYHYTQGFCAATVQPGFIRYRDDLIPDMYYHNYTLVLDAMDEQALAALITTEIAYNKAAGKHYCLIRSLVPVGDSIVAKLPQAPEVSTAGYYVLDASTYTKTKPNANCHVLRVDKPEILEDLLWLDLEHDGQALGVDFCTRRVYRREEIYLSNEGVDAYICYNDGQPVGSCSLFIHGDTAKIEDFAVLPAQQRKGFGTALLNTLIEIALAQGATLFYLEADEGDTAKEMYQKIGFVKVDELTDLIFVW